MLPIMFANIFGMDIFNKNFIQLFYFSDNPFIFHIKYLEPESNINLIST